MPSIGAVWWTAEIRQAEEAADKADRLQEELDQTAEKANESNRAMNRASESADSTGDSFGRTRNSAGRLSGSLTLLTSGIFFLISTLSSLMGISLSLSAAWATVTGVAGTLWGIITTVGAYLAGGLSKGLSLIISLGSKFVGWMAAGSAGAMVVAGAIGAIIGILAVFVLEMTGVLDIVSDFAEWMGSILPNWAIDGILILVSSIIGWLAVLGGAIVGFVEGFLRGGLSEGIDQAVASAMEVLSIFGGAWDRTLGRISGLIDGFIASAKGLFSGFMDWLTGLPGAAASSFKNGFNSILPSQLSIPEISVGGGSVLGQDIPEVSIGGQSIDLPQLNTGGLIERAGAAFLHPGEAVVPADVVRDVESSSGSGGGEAPITIETVEVSIGDQTLDLSTLTRSELRDLADLIGDQLGDEIESLIS